MAGRSCHQTAIKPCTGEAAGSHNAETAAGRAGSRSLTLARKPSRGVSHPPLVVLLLLEKLLVLSKGHGGQCSFKHAEVHMRQASQRGCCCQASVGWRRRDSRCPMRPAPAPSRSPRTPHRPRLPPRGPCERRGWCAAASRAAAAPQTRGASCAGGAAPSATRPRCRCPPPRHRSHRCPPHRRCPPLRCCPAPRRAPPARAGEGRQGWAAGRCRARCTDTGQTAGAGRQAIQGLTSLSSTSSSEPASSCCPSLLPIVANVLGTAAGCVHPGGSPAEPSCGAAATPRRLLRVPSGALAAPARRSLAASITLRHNWSIATRLLLNKPAQPTAPPPLSPLAARTAGWMAPNVPRPEAVLRGHAGEVQALDFDAAERFLVSGCAAAWARCICTSPWRL